MRRDVDLVRALDEADALIMAGQYDAAAAACGHVVAQCDPNDRDIRARAELAWGEALYALDSREREAMAHLTAAAEYGRSTLVEARAWLTMADHFRLSREVERTLAAFRHSALLFAVHDDLYGEYLARTGLEECQRSLGRVNEAIPELARVVDCAFACDATEEGAEHARILGELLYTQGRNEDANAALRVAAGAFHHLGNAREEARALSDLVTHAGDGTSSADDWQRLAELAIVAAVESGNLEDEAITRAVLAEFVESRL